MDEVTITSSAPINIIKRSKVVGFDVTQTYFNLHVEEAWISIEKKREEKTYRANLHMCVCLLSICEYGLTVCNENFQRSCWRILLCKIFHVILQIPPPQ